MDFTTTKERGGDFTLIDWVATHAQRLPDKQAFTFLGEDGGEKESVTFRALHESAAGLAAGLRAMGVYQRPIILLFPTGFAFVRAFLGCLYAGAVPVPAPLPSGKRHHLARVQHMLCDAGAPCVLVDEAWKTRVAEYLRDEGVEAVDVFSLSDFSEFADQVWVEPRVGRDSLAFLQYSSGSTGAPKGVMINHGNVLDNSAVLQARWGGHEASVYGSWLPLFHDMGLIGVVIQVLYLGCTAVLMSPMTFVKRPHLWLRLISDYRVDIAGAPNFGYEHCVKRVSDEQLRGVDLSTWRVAFNGAEPVRDETLRRFSERLSRQGFSPAAQMPCYGLAEATLCVSCHDIQRPHRVLHVSGDDLVRRNAIIPDSEGRPFVACGAVRGGPEPSLDVQIVDPDARQALGENRVGEIWVSGSSVARGYLGKDDESAETFQARIQGQSGTDYLRTGDLGFIHDGQLFVTGRIKDLIVFNGRNVSPEDIEHLALEDGERAAVLGECVAFPVDDGDSEHVVLMLEIGRDVPDVERIGAIAHSIRTRVLAAIQVDISQLLFVKRGVLPRTTSGKKQRRKAQELFVTGAPLEVVYDGCYAPVGVREEAGNAG